MFAPNSAHRARVTPAKRGKGNKANAAATEDLTPTERRAAMTCMDALMPRAQGCARAATWAQRLKRVFNIDIETCKSCGGHVRIIACIEDPVVIEKILTHLDRKNTSTAASRLPPCRAPPQARWFA